MSDIFQFLITVFLARLAYACKVFLLLSVELITACLHDGWHLFGECSVEILPKGVLLFRSVRVSDSAVYTCRAVNAFGSTSKNITLTVHGQQGCRGYGDSHGDSHGYGYGMGMGTVMNPHGFCG